MWKFPCCAYHSALPSVRCKVKRDLEDSKLSIDVFCSENAKNESPTIPACI